MATASDSTSTIKSTCHCGAVTLQVPDNAREINECQCTLCRRYASAWAYYPPKDVKISVKESTPTRKYVWGDKDLEFHFCSVCGCVTHWSSIEERDEMGVNTRNMDPELIKTWPRDQDLEALTRTLREKNTAHAEDKAAY